MDEAQRKEELQVMPLIPLRGLTVYPNMVINFDVGREKSILALERAMMMNQTVFLTSQKDIDTDLPTPKDFFHVGTVAKVKQMLKLPGDNIRVLVDGQYRARIEKMIQEVPYFLAQELIPGYWGDHEGTYCPPKGYFVADENPEAFEAYEATFPPKEKLRLPGQL